MIQWQTMLQLFMDIIIIIIIITIIIIIIISVYVFSVVKVSFLVTGLAGSILLY